MSSYLIVKWLHVLSSVVLVGTGFGTAFYLFCANRSGNVQAIAVVSRFVVHADTWFTFPAVVFQPLSGLWMMSEAGWGIGDGWLGLAFGLYLFAGICWLPVVWLQLRLRDMAAVAARDRTSLPERYWRYARRWEWLGYPAFIAMGVVFYLMVVKP